MRTTPTRRMFVLLVGILVLDRTPIGTAQSERPSVTALEAAAYRVLGSRHPDPAIRNADVVAEKLLGPAERAILKDAGATIVLEALAMDTERAWTTLGPRSVFARGVHVRTRRTLFIWEGVTMYVPEPGIDATLRSIATNAARGSRIVFDYFTERALRDRQSALVPVARNVAAVGEPFVFGMPGDTAAAFAMPSPSANRLCVAGLK